MRNHPRKEIVRFEMLYLSFANRGAAEAFSRRLMRSKQSPETRDDPNTVTEFFYPVTVNEETGKASIEIEATLEHAENFTSNEITRFKTKEQAAGAKERAVEPPQPNGGRSGGGKLGGSLVGNAKGKGVA